MDRRTARLRKRLAKKANRGFRGYPVGTIACYGPDDHRASKIVAAIIESEGAEASEMQKWFSEEGDVRNDPEIIAEMVAFLEEHGACSIAMTARIIGCPHEEGIDYEGPICPRCPFWTDRNRWTGDTIPRDTIH